MAYANSQFVWISQSFCSFFETGSFRAWWCFSLTPILCCWGNLVFDSDSRPNIHFLLFKTENLKKWAHQNTVYLLLNVPLLTCRKKNWNIYCKFENGGKRNVLRKQQTQDLHSKRAPASKSGVCCAFDISIEGWVGAFIRELGRQINLFRGLKRHKFPQRANTEPPVILFCRRWMKEEIGGGGGWLRHHEGKWGCDLILVFPKPQSGRQPAPPLPPSLWKYRRAREKSGRTRWERFGASRRRNYKYKQGEEQI